ncbi:MAG TPA: hypothetical protein VFJ83_06055 [Nocardioidaceae bacterium]|nr:hypothetical protein [Nocardioidaceae bacterium]
MEILRDILVFLHFIGLAALFGGLFVQIKSDPRVVNNAMFHGILTQLVTGVLLVGVIEAAGDATGDFRAKVGVKLVIALVIAALVFVNRKKTLANGLFFGLMGLTALNIAVAVFWNVNA